MVKINRRLEVCKRLDGLKNVLHADAQTCFNLGMIEEFTKFCIIAASIASLRRRIYMGEKIEISNEILEIVS